MLTINNTTTIIAEAQPSSPETELVFRVTQQSGRAHTLGLDEGRTGWRRHAVPEGSQRALCGLLPRHGWGGDLFEDDFPVCSRCSRALDVAVARTGRRV